MKPVLIRAGEGDEHGYDWGSNTWIVAHERENSETMTLGHSVIKAGQTNPRHYHPNCDEVLYLLSGSLEQYIDGQVFILEPGDTVTIPQDAVHQARALGREDAVALVMYSSAQREFVPVSPLA